MKKRTQLLVVLAAVLVLVGLAACSGSNNGNQGSTGTSTATSTPAATPAATPAETPADQPPYPIVKDKIKLKVMGFTGPYLVDWKDNSFFHRMEELTNIQLEYNPIPNESWKERLTLAFASNDLPDMFYKANFNREEEILYSNEGKLIPLEDLINEHAPNIKKLLEDRPDVRKSITLPNGHIVGLPKTSVQYVPSVMWVNQKWLETLGMSEPTTPEEFYDVLKAFKEKDPNGNNKADEIPFSLSLNTGVGSYNADINNLLANWGMVASGNGVFITADDQVKFTYIQPEYKEFLAFMNKLYMEKLLDNDLFIQNSQQLSAKGQTEDALLGSFITCCTQSLVGLERETDYVGLAPFKTKDGRQMWSINPGVQTGRFAITSANKYPVETIRWVDYLYSEEGRILAWMGKEGEEYVMNPDGTWNWKVDSTDEVSALRSRATIQPGGSEVGGQPELWQKLNDPEELWLIENRNKAFPYAVTSFPIVNLESNDSKRASAINADATAYVNQMMSQFIITEGALDREWDNYVRTLKQIGVEELETIYNNAYQAYLKN